MRWRPRPGSGSDLQERHPIEKLLSVRSATANDLQSVRGVLLEAATWLRNEGIPLWREDELLPELIERDVANGLFVVADVNGEAAGTMKFQLTDPDVWPEIPEGESTFIHRLAVRRAHAGGVVSSALLDWALTRTRELGREYLRLDCDAHRPKLRQFYSAHGFTYHSDFQFGPYLVARFEKRAGRPIGG